MTRSVVLLAGLGSWLLLACSGNSSTDASTAQPTAGTGGALAGSGGGVAETPTSGTAGQVAAAGGGAGGTSMAGAGGAAGSALLGGGAGAGGGDTAGAAGAPQNLPKSEDFTCSWILGITTTGEWYKAGFEKVVDDARWQITPIEMGHLEKWADPAHEIWQSSIQSACTKNSKTPDRIVFNATKYEWTTVDEFLPAYIAVVSNIKTKYPSVKRIDLMTYGRAPGNQECVDANRPTYSYIKAVQDEAAAMIPAMYPGLVFVAPKWEHQSCSDFGLCPHVADAANATLAKTIGEYFLKN